MRNFGASALSDPFPFAFSSSLRVPAFIQGDSIRLPVFLGSASTMVSVLLLKARSSLGTGKLLVMTTVVVVVAAAADENDLRSSVPSSCCCLLLVYLLAFSYCFPALNLPPLLHSLRFVVAAAQHKSLATVHNGGWLLHTQTQWDRLYNVLSRKTRQVFHGGFN